MKALLIALAVVIGGVGFFIAMFAQPLGWVVVVIGIIALFVVLLKRDIGARRILVQHARRHGPEDLGRGPNEDPMK